MSLHGAAGKSVPIHVVQLVSCLVLTAHRQSIKVKAWSDWNSQGHNVPSTFELLAWVQSHRGNQ